MSSYCVGHLLLGTRPTLTLEFLYPVRLHWRKLIFFFASTYYLQIASCLPVFTSPYQCCYSVWLGPVQSLCDAATASVHLCVHQSCCAWKTPFPWSNPSPLTLIYNLLFDICMYHETVAMVNIMMLSVSSQGLPWDPSSLFLTYFGEAANAHLSETEISCL